jgi:hypothetical protein
MLSHTWTIRAAQVSVSLSTPKTVIQYVANASYAAEILDFAVTQAASTTSAMERVRLGKISVAGTGLVAAAVGTNIFRWGSADDTFKGQLGTSLTGTGVGVTPVEPTYTDLPREFDFNVLNGWPGGSCPQGSYYVPPGGMVGIRLAGIVAGTWDVELIVHEFA